jgi:hypothetical protein
MERRGATRYQLRLVVAFSWKDEAGVLNTGEGRSRDVTSRGIYVHSDLTPPVSAHVDMNVLLPNPQSLTSPAELHAEGRVVRIDPTIPAYRSSGFAVMNHTAILRDSRGRIVDDKDSWDDFGRDRKSDRD